MTKKSILLPAMLLVVFFAVSSVFGQESVSSSVQASDSSTAEMSSPQNSFNFNYSVPAAASDRAPSSFGLFVRMVFVLLVVLGLVYVAVYFLKKSTRQPVSDDPFLRNVAGISLGGGKSVQVVTLLDHAYILGVSDNSVNPIAEIEDKELVDSLNLYSDKNNNQKKPRSFADVLDIFMPHGPRDENVFRNTTKDISDVLKSQRDRFNRGE